MRCSVLGFTCCASINASITGVSWYDGSYNGNISSWPWEIGDLYYILLCEGMVLANNRSKPVLKNRFIAYFGIHHLSTYDADIQVAIH